MTPKKTILIADDDEIFRSLLSILLKREGFTVLEAETAEEGYRHALDEEIDLVLLDIGLPMMGGEALLARLRADRPNLPTVIITGSIDEDLAERCLNAGAVDFLSKPCDAPKLITTIRNVLRLRTLENRLREVQDGISGEQGYELLYGQSPAMRKVFDQLRALERSDISVLIEGPSGTGKELVARSLHRRGKRAAGPFVAINCGAIPETMLESELFGHEKGAFTGAQSSRAGCFEQSHGGTLFLDEIGEMRPDMQVRLLRALENHEIRRLGGTRTFTFDVRVIAATNRDLRECIASGSFREDLYFRLSVFRLELPTLKSRGDDVLGLAERFLTEFSARLHKRFQGFDGETRSLLKQYDWPGNIRELRNCIERAVLMADGNTIHARDFPQEILAACGATRNGFMHTEAGGSSGLLTAVPMALTVGGAVAEAPPPASIPAPGVLNGLTTVAPLGGKNAATSAPPSGYTALTGASAKPETADDIQPFDEEERRILQRALTLTHGDVADAAQRLKIGRATLYRKIKELNLNV